MATRHLRERAYDASDIKVLMDNTGGWARNWDDVLRYLEGTAVKHADFPGREVPQLMNDVRSLKNADVHFTVDYRQVWKELTGEAISDLPPQDVKSETDPMEQEDKYLNDPDVPVDSNDGAANRSGTRKPASRVEDVLQRVESKEYKEMARLMESTRGASWNHH